MYKVRFNQSFLKYRLHKIWVIYGITYLMFPLCAVMGHPVIGFVISLIAAMVAFTFLLLTRCPKCGNKVLGIVGWPPLNTFHVFPTHVPEKCPYGGYAVEPDHEAKAQTERASYTQSESSK